MNFFMGRRKMILREKKQNRGEKEKDVRGKSKMRIKSDRRIRRRKMRVRHVRY